LAVVFNEGLYYAESSGRRHSICDIPQSPDSAISPTFLKHSTPDLPAAELLAAQVLVSWPYILSALFKAREIYPFDQILFAKKATQGIRGNIAQIIDNLVDDSDLPR
jgi:hypothetical protein